jgi:ribonuclease R
LIEEFMIRINEVVASHFSWENVDSLYRVHEGPDADKVKQFRDFIGGLGLRLGGRGQPKSKDFQRLVEHLEGQPGERVIIYLMLRTMKQARYQPNNIGHFGLASERYTHFTSPIRRYPDLVIHRLQKSDLGSTKQQEFDVEGLQGDLQRIGADCSERERNAEEAERRYVDWKMVQFMSDKLGDSFEAFVTGVHAYGFFVELDRFFVNGLVHISSLADDYYMFDEGRHTLKGVNNGRVITLGNRVKVKFVKVDKGRRRLDFALEEGPLETGIKPLLAQKDGQGRAEDSTRRRRRRRPRKTASKDVAKGHTTLEVSEQTADKRNGKETKANGERRRRGSRRGRSRGRGARDGSRPAEASAVEKTDGSATDGPAKQTRRPSRSGQSKTPTTKTSSRSSDSNRKHNTSSRKKVTKTTTKKVEGPKEGTQRPKVNPYLTDL